MGANDESSRRKFIVTLVSLAILFAIVLIDAISDGFEASLGVYTALSLIAGVNGAEWFKNK